MRSFSIIVILFLSNNGCLSSPVTANNTQIWRTRPTGHCDPVCTCSTEGLYFSEGEQWVRAREPCTILQCMASGQMDVVSRGCLFNGVCKTAGSTWSDHCNTYSCVEGPSSVFYRLDTAGCFKEDGQCMAIGERQTNGCDIYECQILAESLNISRIRTGCSIDGTCKQVNSFWHNGCSILTCAVENGLASPRSLTNETMLWPEGNYAMFKPKSGCPVDVTTHWAEGYRKHAGDGQNQYSMNMSAAGVFNGGFMRHEFCVHTSVPDPQAGYKFVTHWEPGRYCILRSQGSCPRGFTEGYLHNDDNDSKAHLSASGGTLPDGNFTSDTGFYFCCRSDGNVQSEIMLPKDKSFILFMSFGETKCQSVLGMTSSVEYMTSDGSPDSKHRAVGDVSAFSINQGDVRVPYCVYTPIECGCPDGSGGFVSIDSERRSECITRKCMLVNGKYELHIVKGGCSVDGRCEDEGAEWSVANDDTCSRVACKRIEAGPNPVFEAQIVAEGCYQGNTCYDVGAEIQDGCYTKKCVNDTSLEALILKPVKADCPWLNECRAVNSTWRHGCMTYRCDMNVTGDLYQWNVQPVEYACEWNNTCYNQNSTWSDGCVTYRCDVTRHAEEVNWSVETVSVGCQSFDGTCIDVNATMTDGCVMYRCNLRHNRLTLEPEAVGCDVDGTCRDENETWTDGGKCVDYVCQKITKSTGSVMQISIVDYGCVFNGSCKAVNTTWEDGCRTRKCTVEKNATAIQRSVDVISAGCDDAGICRPLGFEKVSNSCMTYQCIFNKEYNDAFFTLTNGGCKADDGTCKMEGETWVSKKQNRCILYRCLKEKQGYLSKAEKLSCMGADKKCYNVGESDFPAVVKKKRRASCRCEHALKKTSVRIRCKG